MTIVALLILPISALFIRFIVKRSQNILTKKADYLGHVNGHVEECFGGHIVVKAFNGEKRSIEEFNSVEYHPL
jgi:ATP-binding cassette subfamily B protein